MSQLHRVPWLKIYKTFNSMCNIHLYDFIYRHTLRYSTCNGGIASCAIPHINSLTPNDHYSGHTTPLTSKRCILYIYSTNIVTEYFKHGIYSPFFSLKNAVCFIILTYLFLYYSHFIYRCAKIKKKKNSGAKRLKSTLTTIRQNLNYLYQVNPLV